MIEQQFFNKKGNTFQFWIEIIIFIGLFLVVVGVIGIDMNSRYGQEHDLTLGLNLTDSVDSLQSYKGDLVNSTSSGDAEITDFGVLKLRTVPRILLSTVGILWTFVSGTFIYAVIMNMQLGAFGQPLAIFFQMLYVITISFLLLKLVLRSPV